jgi:membrane dipeptidase
MSELHKKSIVAIGHDHTMIGVMTRREQGEQAVFSNHVAPLIRYGGVDVLGLVVGGDRPRPEKGGGHPWWDTHALIDALWQEAEESSDTFAICQNGSDIDRTTAAGQLAVLLMLEGGRPITEGPGEDPLVNLRTLYRLGVRGVQFLGSGWNALVNATPEAEMSEGLSQLGVDVVREMNRLGMVIDLAHVPDDDSLFWDIVEISEAPLIASHHSVRKVNEIPGALGDEGIKAIAGKGGVVGITFSSKQLNTTVEHATLSDLLRHIDHIAALVGTDYIGLGPDFGELRHVGLDSQSYYIEGVHDLARIPRVTESLLKTGYSDIDVRKILGQNFLRVYQQVV